MGPKRTSPLNPARNTSSVPPAPVAKADLVVNPVEMPTAPVASAVVSVKSPGVPSSPLPSHEKVQSPVPAPAVQPRTLPPAATTVAANARDLPTVVVADGDIAIFEQLRHQLILWLRIEVVRSGLDISNQAPSQLLELLRQQKNYDETRLQVVSTLLNLANQVIKNGQASLFEYRQALMFHLMHTKR